ncbi:PAS domain S-box protein [Novosphingobium sp. M1R2S20]|uniref:histidine kinase n=1 Tax=Novosphingobium rhizovicinum TaxID=3228928 RepID=A0ABV3RBN5_9SPHN
MRKHDWSTSPLGDPDGWPQSLRLVVSLILSSKFPMFVAWGKELGFLYNDAYAEVLGAKHPSAIGRRFYDIWAEIWPDIAPLIDAAMAGEATYREDLPLLMHRKGFDEQTWFTFSYSPVRDENGQVAGMFCACTETTARILAERAISESEARFRNMADHAPVMMWVTDATGACTYLNRSWYTFTGQSHEEAEGFGWLDATHPEDKAAAEQAFLDANRARMPLRIEYRLRRADGTYRWVIDAAAPRFGDDREFLGFAGSVIDIDTRRDNEERQRNSEATLRQVTNTLPAFVWLAAPDGNLHYFNDRWYEYTGQSPHEALPSGWIGVLHPDDVEETARRWADARERGVTYQIEVRYRRRDGQYRWYVVRAEPLREEDGTIKGWVGTSIDIHDQKQIESALRASEAEFRLMADAVPQIIWITDADARVQFFNRHWFDYTGAKSQSETAEDINEDYVHPDDKAVTMAAFARARQNRTTFTVEHRIRSAAGEYRWFLVRGEPYADPETGKVLRWYGASVDIHDRRVAEAELQQLNKALEGRNAAALAERKLLADLVEGTDAFVHVVGPDYRWLAVNKSAADEFERNFGKRPRVGEHMLELLEADAEQRSAIGALWSRALAGEEFTAVDEFTDSDGVRHFYESKFNSLRDADGLMIGAYQFVHDITDRVQEQVRLRVAEEALRQSQKMEAMGQLTGGVAHDFNNLLTPIVGGLDMLQRRGVGGEREQRLIAGAMQSAERAKTLVQRLLAFARRQPLQAVPVDVADLVRGMGDLITSTTGPQVRLMLDFPSDLSPATADPNQLEMALLNLSVNARDAMPDGGTLTIAAREEQVSEGAPIDLAPGRYIQLSVADTGTGMDKETLSRAVEPFFSTKGVGKGTGLGLSMVHGLASQLGGALTVASEPGCGTSVTLWLPCSDVGLPASSCPTASEAPPSGATALLVDDEDLVRMSTAAMLQDLGYTVIEAASAEQALALVQAGQKFDVLVTDHLMPGMSGMELVTVMRAERSQLAALLVSGYADDQGIDASLLRLSKPFRKDELGEMLARLSRSRRTEPEGGSDDV